MSRYKEIKERIQQHYEKLPVNQRKIAEYFIESFDRIPFLNVQEVSEATSSSVASIVRFAQRVGFSGYSAMRDEIATTLQQHIENKEIFTLFDKSKINQDFLTSVANQDIQNINETILSTERASFKKAIDLIVSSEKVCTLGLGISHLLAKILSYQLSQVAVPSYTFTNNSFTFLEQLLTLKTSDLIIAFSFPPYSKETIEAAKFASERKIKVISITNKQTAPVSFYSDVTLIVKSENMLFTNSFAAISVIINAIATECAVRNKSKAKKMIKDLNKLLEIQNNTIE